MPPQAEVASSRATTASGREEEGHGGPRCAGCPKSWAPPRRADHSLLWSRLPHLRTDRPGPDLHRIRPHGALPAEDLRGDRRGGSLTRAAERVFTSAPAVSAQLKALEDELGVKLFERMPRGMVLTEAGERLLDEAGARSTLALRHALRGRAAARRGAGRGALRHGGGPGLLAAGRGAGAALGAPSAGDATAAPGPLARDAGGGAARRARLRLRAQRPRDGRGPGAAAARRRRPGVALPPPLARAHPDLTLEQLPACPG